MRDKQKVTLVVGLGVTGLSCVRFLHQQGEQVIVVDTRENPPLKTTLFEHFPSVSLLMPEALPTLYSCIDRAILSPGLDPRVDWIENMVEQGISIQSDIDLLCENTKKPIVAVTGTNGKSTVVHQIAHILEEAGFRACVIGNVGYPVLDALMDGQVELSDYVVLELSSFQLEITSKLEAEVACITNVREDHLDRHGNMDVYISAKHRIYRNAKTLIYNSDDKATVPSSVIPGRRLSYGASSSSNDEILIDFNRHTLILNNKRCIDLSSVSHNSFHHLYNAALSTAVGIVLGLDCSVIEAALKSFVGLPHRCEWVGNFDSVDFINDSKGTNIAATEAALKSIALYDRPIILLIGGVAKGQDFSAMRISKDNQVKAVVVYGRDRDIIKKTLHVDCPVYVCDILSSATNKAFELMASNDLVLFSPACASFDEFNNFEERGKCFAQIVSTYIADNAKLSSPIS